MQNRYHPHDNGVITNKNIRLNLKISVYFPAPSLRAGVQNLLQTVGLGKLKTNTLVLGFKTLWKTVHEQEMEEYVNIIHDAFEMNYGVVILRVAADFVMSEDAVEGDEVDADWAGEDIEDGDRNRASSEVGGTPSEFGRFRCETIGEVVNPEEGQAQVCGENENSEKAMKSPCLSNSLSGSKESLVNDGNVSFEKLENDDNNGKDDEEKDFEEKDDNRRREAARSKSEALQNVFSRSLPVNYTNDREPPKNSQSPVTDSPPVVIRLETPSSPSGESCSSSTRKHSKECKSESPSSLSSDNINTGDEVKHDEIQDKKQPQVQEEEESGEADETTMLFPESQPSVQENVKLTFTEKVSGHIDVWWLFDDGGLTILIPYLLSLSRYWKGCKLRIFSPESTRHIKTNQLKMASLLKKFRIDFSGIVEVRGINRRPSEKSIKNFLKLPLKEELKNSNLDKKTLRHIRIGELLREESLDAQLIVMSLPVPRLDVTPPSLYMSWLEVLTANLPPVLLVRGNQSNVLTFYS